MDALTLLKEQHDEIDQLFASIEATDELATKGALFEELADKLAAHARIEESHFYPAVMARRTKDLVIEFTEEHLAIEHVLADLLDLDPEDHRFGARLRALKDEVSRHAREEEEGDLFPRVRRLLDADELAALGAEMAREFDDLVECEPRYASDAPWYAAAM